MKKEGLTPTFSVASCLGIDNPGLLFRWDWTGLRVWRRPVALDFRGTLHTDTI
ncbi:hypothetical protein CcrC1_gp200 [Caulobacter phage C1]|nr:hypothetical protein CcrC1_gp200 [Caulobacter phage C1]UTU08429.1 hypothetical protein CcrC2_gp201 [Caulobacter phage C2]UTU08946.1 hypothetical protein CcrJ4_gp195 [Caulobacter phage J4]UTU09502.1 hypothetical protein CcrBL47_gp216 [Caulobacter phage BL47]UTU10062.1 hypothetical protein CcrRB23_gp200 [Caulobacter phage RB23]WGN97097.1 hypothetical protein [Bertelyvirus sp.]